MATITASTTPEPRTRTRTWRRGQARAALAAAARKGAAMASEARHRYRRPSLVIASFTAATAAAWTTFGRGAGLTALAAALAVFELLGGEE